MQEQEVLDKCHAIRAAWTAAHPPDFNYATSTPGEWLDYDKLWRHSPEAKQCRKLVSGFDDARRAVAEADYNRRAGLTIR